MNMRSNIILIALSFSLIGVASADLSDGLLAHYKFDGDANDSSGNGNHGTEYNGVTYAAGTSGQAASFDGIDDYIQAGVLLDKNSESFTVSAWVDNSGNGGSIWFQYPNNSYHTNHFFSLRGDNRLSHDEFTPSGGYFISTNSVTSGFHLLTTTRNGTTRKIYIDGALVDEDNLGETYTGSEPTSTLIGARLYNNVIYEPELYSLYGLIDDLRIYNRALTDTEIYELYHEATALKPEIKVEGGYFNADTTSGSFPAASDCAGEPHYGRMTVDEVNSILYICTQAGWDAH